MPGPSKAKKSRVTIGSESENESESSGEETKRKVRPRKQPTKKSEALSSGGSSSDEDSDEEWTAGSKAKGKATPAKGKGGARGKQTKRKRSADSSMSDGEVESDQADSESDKSEPEEGEVSDDDSGNERSAAVSSGSRRRSSRSAAAGAGASNAGGSSGSEAERDDDEDDDEEFADGFDENLVGDDEDRRRLEQMTEKEREQELYDRAQRREVLRTRFEIQKKLKRRHKKEQGGGSRSASAAAGTAVAAAAAAGTPSGKKGQVGGSAASSAAASSAAAVAAASKSTSASQRSSERKKTLENRKDSMRMSAMEALRAKRSEKNTKVKQRQQQKEQQQQRAEQNRKEASTSSSESSDESDANGRRGDDEVGEGQGAAAAGDGSAAGSGSSSDSSSSSSNSSSGSEESDGGGDGEEASAAAGSGAAASGAGSRADRRSSGAESGNEEGAAVGGPNLGNDRQPARAQFVTTKDEVESIRLSRHRLEVWCHMPFFKKTVTGCFVRVNIGQNAGKPVYRCTEVLDIVETNKVYQLGKTRTNKGLKLGHGNAERVYRMEYVSNVPFSDSEFQHYKEATMLSGMQLPSVAHVEQKVKDLKEAATYQLAEADIDTVLQEKLRFKKTPFNYGARKAVLLKEKEAAEGEGDLARADEVGRQLEELEDRARELDRARVGNLNSITYINQRNRMRNIADAESAAKVEMEEMKNAKADPFTRRKSRPTIVTKARNPEQGLKVKEMLKAELKEAEELVLKHQRDKAAAAAAAGKSHGAQGEDGSAGGGTQHASGDKERQQSDDLFSVHDFDIKIDLPSIPLTTHGPMTVALKPPSATAAKDTAPRRSLDLEAYKKRKGLI